MALFGGHKQPEAAGRRRPAIEPTANRPMFSYHAQQRVIREKASGQTDRRQVKPELTIDQRQSSVRPARQPLRIAGIITVLALVLLATSMSTTPKVSIVGASAAFLQPAPTYQQAATRNLSGSLFNHNKLTFDNASLQLDLLRSYPEIKSVHVKTSVFSFQPQLAIMSYDPSLVLTTGGHAYLLDESGRALATTSQAGDVDITKLVTLQDQSTLQVSLGKKVIPSTTVQFVQTVAAAANHSYKGFSTFSLLPGSYELDAVPTGKSYTVKFNLTDDALQQAGAYLAVRQNLEQKAKTPAQYIDVRVAERAYYK